MTEDSKLTEERMSKFSFDGKVSLTFSNEMDFPADIADKLNDRDNTDTLTVVSKAETRKLADKAAIEEKEGNHGRGEACNLAGVHR